MITRRRVMGKKKGLLPSGYTQVEYIENTGDAYINTGVYTECEHTFELETTISWDTLENRQLNGSNHAHWIGINGNKWDLGVVSSSSVIADRWYNVRAVVIYENGVTYTELYVDGTRTLITQPISSQLPRNLQVIFTLCTNRTPNTKYRSYDKKKSGALSKTELL